MDQRKVALEQYLQHMLSLPMEDTTDISEFICTNVIDSNIYQTVGQKREGYLTKRGKNFGGWKTRYFVLNESVLEYYESVSYYYYIFVLHFLIKNLCPTSPLLL